MKIDANDLRFLHEMAHDVIDASRVRPGQRVGNSPPNTQPHVLIRPGGRDCYPAMWVRDFSMSLDCGLIPADEIKAHLQFISSRQNGINSRKLKSGALIPPNAVPDHINFDGSAVFYPGAYSSGEDQGGEPFGIGPPMDDNFELIHIAHHAKAPTDPAWRSAFDSVPHDPSTGMVTTSAANRAVGFGFCDAVYLTGQLLFPSLLRYRAAMELNEPAIAERIRLNLVSVFADQAHRNGWLLAATDVGRVPDVWGTLYALHLAVLPPDFADFARSTVAEAYNRRTITLDAAVRHVPTDHDASPTSAWPRVMPGLAVNTYQNGAYWHVPTGWLISALHRSQPQFAAEVWRDYIRHLREQDFRRGASFGAPWECFGKDCKARQNPVYMASVTVPLAVIEQLQGQ